MSSKPKPWTKTDIPSLTGKLAIVTGATSGLGYETALALAEAGATVILACRNEEKTKAVIEQMLALVPNAKLVFEQVDLASLNSVAQFSTRIKAKYEVVDILVNNAGVIIFPDRQVTEDGFELHFGTNHLAHFALTVQLLPMLRKSGSSRVVNVSSLENRNGQIHFEDLQLEKTFSPGMAYAQSKVANNLFTLELQRRSDEGGWGIRAVTAHPGFAFTPVLENGFSNTWKGWVSMWMLPYIGQDAANGALPQLFAAVSAEAKPAGYYGPNGFHELKGSPAPAYSVPAVLDVEAATKLWEVSEKLAGVSWV